MPSSREEIVQQVVAAYAAQGHSVRHDAAGRWAVMRDGIWVPAGSSLNSSLERAADYRATMSQREEAAGQRVEQEAAAAAQASRMAGAQSAAAGMTGPGGQQFRVDSRTGQLYGGYVEYGSGQRSWSTWVQAGDRDRQEFERRQAEAQDGPAPDIGGPMTPEQRIPVVNQEEASRRPRGGFHGGRNTFVEGLVASLAGAGIAGLAGAASPLAPLAGYAMSPLGGTGQAAVGVGQGVTDLLISGLRSATTLGGVALGTAFAMFLPGPIGLGIGMVVGAIGTEIANAFGSLGKTVTGVIGDIGKAVGDLVNVGRQLSTEVMGISYRTGQGPRAGAQLVGLEQSFGLAPGMFSSWADRPEFLSRRLGAFGINAMGQNGELDYAGIMGGLRGMTRGLPSLMQIPMLRAATGSEPSTELLGAMNMPEKQFRYNLDMARSFEQNADGMRSFYEALRPSIDALKVIGQGIRLDFLTALTPVFKSVVDGLANLWATNEPKIRDWLAEKLPGYLQIGGLAVLNFAEAILKALPGVLTFLGGLENALGRAYGWVQQNLPGLGLPALPGGGGPGGAGGAGSGVGAGIPGVGGGNHAGAGGAPLGTDPLTWLRQHPWANIAAGAGAGAAMGAGIGTWIMPGLGTAGGAAIGAVVGGLRAGISSATEMGSAARDANLDADAQLAAWRTMTPAQRNAHTAQVRTAAAAARAASGGNTPPWVQSGIQDLEAAKSAVQNWKKDMYEAMHQALADQPAPKLEISMRGDPEGMLRWLEPMMALNGVRILTTKLA